MSVTIIEALQCAEINLARNGADPFSRQIGLSQLRNAIGLLDKGYPPHMKVEPILQQYETVEATPEYVEPRPQV